MNIAPQDDTVNPVKDLVARYRAVLGAAWRARHELAGPARLADEAAFLPAALSLQATPVHPAPRRLAALIIALFVIALVWAIVGQVDIVANATGRIVVSERTKLVQPLERSVVKRILVSDGDRVVAGQPLVELDPTAANADKATVDEYLKSAESDVARARTLLAWLSSGGHPAQTSPTAAQLNAEWADISARLARLASETSRRKAEIATARELVAKAEATLPLARQREADFKKLTDQGFMNHHAGQDRTRERIELERDLATQRARLLEAQAALQESENTHTSYIAETRRNLRDREAQADLKRLQAVQDLGKARQREKLTTLTAPVAGTVQQLAVNTMGGVVTEAQPLMVIVPEAAEVTAEVTLENKDIGFVYVGQAARIKLETFMYTRYGTIDARVIKVSADAVNDEKRGAIFPATLTLDTTTIDIDGKKVRLSPGMNVTAEIKTGKHRVIDYLLSPIQRAKSESFGER